MRLLPPALLSLATVASCTAIHQRGSCNHDNCLRALIRAAGSATSFCSSYLVATTTTGPLPTWAGGCGGLVLKVKSACSCIVTVTNVGPASSSTTAVEVSTASTVVTTTEASTTSTTEVPSTSTTATSTTEVPTISSTTTSTTEVPSTSSTTTSTTEVPTTSSTTTSTTEVLTTSSTTTSTTEVPTTSSTTTSTTETSTTPSSTSTSEVPTTTTTEAPTTTSSVPSSARTSPPPGAVIVSPDGLNGACKTIQCAIDSLSVTAPAGQVVFVYPGVYTEQVYIPPRAANLTIYGYTPDSTTYTQNTATLTYNLALINTTTDDLTATLRAWTTNLKIYNLNIANTFGHIPKNGQNLAVSAHSPNQGYYACQLLGFQDTLLANTGRQVYAKCLITGAVDFIFGQTALAWLDGCDIRTIDKGSITASGRADALNPSWYVLNECDVRGINASIAPGANFLGRPWRSFARVVFQFSYLGDVINPAGWRAWSLTDPTMANTGNVTFGEYANFGPGSVATVGAGVRAPFSSQLDAPVLIEDILGANFRDESWVDGSYLSPPGIPIPVSSSTVVVATTTAVATSTTDIAVSTTVATSTTDIAVSTTAATSTTDIAVSTTVATSTTAIVVSTTVATDSPTTSTTAVPATTTTPVTPASPCTVTAFSALPAATSPAAACSTIVLQSITVPGGVSLDLSKLVKGTTVVFSGVTNFTYFPWVGDVIKIGGTDITVTATPDAIIDGNGPAWWDGQGSNGGGLKPNHFITLKLLGFSTVQNLTIQNYPTHCFYISNNANLVIRNILLNNTLGNLPNAISNGLPAGHNTDGFGIASSTNITLMDSTVLNQDDCVAITSGDSITVKNMWCDGGHGLSIGSVGGKSNNNVTNIIFQDSVVLNSENGPRIKTNYNTTGYISNITYANIQLKDITTRGIDIQQDYLNGGPTGTPSNGVTITGITMRNVTGNVLGAAMRGMDYYILCGTGSCSNFVFEGVSVIGGVGDSCNFLPEAGNFAC